MRRFYLYRRSEIYYVKLVDTQTGRTLPGKSTHSTNRDEAAAIALQWLKNGIPQNKQESRSAPESFTFAEVASSLRTLPLSKKDVKKLSNILIERGLLVSAVIADDPGAELFSDFITRFWTFAESPYVAEKHSHGYRMGKTHSKESLGRARRYWVPYFAGKHLSEITRADLKAFTLHLSDEKLKLTPVTRNRILRVGTTALRWAYENDLITENVVSGVSTFSEKLKKRGILSPIEVKKLFSLQWDDERVMLGNMLAASTGLRVAEITALKPENIGTDFLSIEHSYSEHDGLKCTKTDEVRRVPLLPSLRAALLTLAKKNPYSPDGFIFYGITPAKPMNQRLMLYGLQGMLIRLSVGDDATKKKRDEARAYWKKRNVVFHSWRHFYASRMTDRVTARKVMLATGHTTEAVFNGYASHGLENDFREVLDATEKVFENIVPFAKEA